ncbi:hypothetical protein On2M_12840 [Citrobacter sp. On2M]|nr:hypothetical protein [Citrobacter sp. On2M]
MQLNAGLNHLSGILVNESAQAMLIVIITALATVSRFCRREILPQEGRFPLYRFDYGAYIGATAV